MERKKEHIENYLKASYETNSLFSCVYLEHNALPSCDFSEIDLSCDFFKKKIPYPLYINAMTGGCDEAFEINEKLARLANEFKIPMAVGSQSIGLKKCNTVESFKIVREILGDDGIVIGNLSANAGIDDILKAEKMINSDVIQIHLNSAQELTMPEGDRTFKHWSENLSKILKEYDKPIIIKEVGFGISSSVAEKLYNLGVRNIDVSGKGGSNFIEIEDLRNFDMDFSDMYEWGIPTSKALIDVKNLNLPITLFASGGIKTANDAIKCLTIGADFVGLGGELLSYLSMGGYDAAKTYIQNFIYKMKIQTLLLGKRTHTELKEVGYKVTGKLRDLMQDKNN